MKKILKQSTYAVSVVAVMLASLMPMQASAHRTWLLPSSTQLEGNEEWLTVDAAVSENLFPFDTNTLKLDRLTVTGRHRVQVTPENQFSGRLRSSFDLKLPKSGTYKISMGNESVMASYKLNGETKRWRGPVSAMQSAIPADAEDLKTTTILSRLETYVSSGKPSNAAVNATGNGLEVIPLTHPNEFMVGEKTNFRVQLDGKPLPNFKLAVVPGGVRYRGLLKEIAVVTNVKGEFSVKLPEAGMYWIGAGYPAREQAMEGPEAAKTPSQPPEPPAKRYTYSGTFEVLPL
ncbi:MAG: DUF4198 domain-containing protein [Burkholderiaceae bacterium]